MDVAKLSVMLLVAASVGCASVSSRDSLEYETFKGYAMAVCLGTAFSDEAVKSDFNKSANGFMERGNMPIDAYEELRGLVNQWLDKDYPSKYGGQVVSAKCFDLVKSDELHRVYDKHDPCDSFEGWWDRESFEKNCE